ncbi:MAG: hydroxyacid dehydrogenase [Ruminococcaceae bacterium]|nr:hydroxyacid dehydrogenase [Oscillospiraceae bacterium]
MRSIFLCEKDKNIIKVYSEETVSLLSESAALDRTVFTKADLLEDPEGFSDVEYIFSTWGMPTLEESEIRTLLPSLKCVFYAAGTVQKFARPFLACGVKVFSAWAANAIPVAEFTVAEIILANKGFYRQSRLMKSGEHKLCKELTEEYKGNYGEKVGLIGVGMIGSLVAEMLKAYKLNVLVFDPFLSDEKAERLGVKKTSLEEIFSSCRVVSNHLANNEQTKRMLSGKYFSLMLPCSTFINTGRGAQVVEEDLAALLRERPDVTALLDVTYPEPPVDGHPFYSLPNCVLTPHIAGSLANETHRMAEYMAEEFRLYTEGLPCRYEVTEKMLETMA